MPAIPAGERIYAIGDIHGRLDLLDDVLARIDADDAGRRPARTSLIFLGDIVDRGADSAGVIDRLMGLAKEKPTTRFLLGNHEEVFLLAASGEDNAVRLFCRIGGRETILSYGISEDEYFVLSFEQLADRIVAAVPSAHLDFVRRFEDLIQIGDYIFVHAGVRPGVALDKQTAKDLRWIREPFLTYRGDLPGIVVHGHTILADVDEQANRIGIDTGAFATGRLTALGLEGTEKWYLQSGV
ncbi:metallophosphoesterase family protein [uncultured Sphingomonas sp.]|uniref:metallophosphoesterase family protein n=1 Tax=uncultured Sphingomonas sp. TaxID=158754 RepID=UPI0035CCA248